MLNHFQTNEEILQLIFFLYIYHFYFNCYKKALSELLYDFPLFLQTLFAFSQGSAIYFKKTYSSTAYFLQKKGHVKVSTRQRLDLHYSLSLEVTDRNLKIRNPWLDSRFLLITPRILIFD